MIRDEKGKLAVDAGCATEALTHFMGPLANTYTIVTTELHKGDRLLAQSGQVRKTTNFFDNEFDPSKHLVTASTPSAPDGDRSYRDVGEVRIYNTHAYSVVGYDNQTGNVEIANPHDTSKTFTLHLDVFNDIFSKISYIGINPLAYMIFQLPQNTSSSAIEQIIDNALQQYGNIYDLCGIEKGHFDTNNKFDKFLSLYDDNPTIQLALYNKLLLFFKAEKIKIAQFGVPVGKMGRGELKSFRYLGPFSIHLGKGVHLKITKNQRKFYVAGNDGSGWKHLGELSSISRTIVGRGGRSSILVDKETVSSEHVFINVRGNIITVIDNSSTNGTVLGEG